MQTVCILQQQENFHLNTILRILYSTFYYATCFIDCTVCAFDLIHIMARETEWLCSVPELGTRYFLK